MTPIDLRSDTVTKPTPGMRAAMAAAEVGDDQFGEDPTINALQLRVAELLGKEAALWLPSGTMANQVALRALTHPGDDVIVSRECHAVWHETGGGAALELVDGGILLGLLVADLGRGHRGEHPGSRDRGGVRAQVDHAAQPNRAAGAAR